MWKRIKLPSFANKKLTMSYWGNKRNNRFRTFGYVHEAEIYILRKTFIFINILIALINNNVRNHYKQLTTDLKLA